MHGRACGTCVRTHLHSLPSATVWGEFLQRWKVLPEEGGQAWPFVLLWDYCSWLPGALKAIPYSGHRHELPETKTQVSLTCPKSTQDFPANLGQANIPKHATPCPSSSWNCLLFLPPLPAFFPCVFLLSTFSKYSLSTYCVLALCNRPWRPIQEPCILHEYRLNHTKVGWQTLGGSRKRKGAGRTSIRGLGVAVVREAPGGSNCDF